MTIDIPAPFNQNSNDIINKFVNFSNNFTSIMNSLISNMSSSSNGINELLNVVIAPINTIENITEPFTHITDILNTYSTSWTSPNNFANNIIQAFLYIQYLLPTAFIITPEIYHRIIESSIDISFATIHRSSDFRILSLPYKAEIASIDTILKSTDLKLGQYGNVAKLDLQLYKQNIRTDLFTFKDIQINKMYLLSFLFTIVSLSTALYFRERWRKLPFKIGL